VIYKIKKSLYQERFLYRFVWLFRPKKEGILLALIAS
jgi:hypothetical protein